MKKKGYFSFIFINKFTAAKVKPRISLGCRSFEDLTYSTLDSGFCSWFRLLRVPLYFSGVRVKERVLVLMPEMVWHPGNLVFLDALEEGIFF